MVFRDRQDAGRLLADKLKKFANIPNGIVIGLPRGGVVVAAEVANSLHLPLDIVVTRKIGAPGYEEFAIGAISQDGQMVFDTDSISAHHIDQQYIKKTVALEQKEAQRRLVTYRGNATPLQLHNRTVILVDDGIATGYTILAAIKYIQSQKPKKLIVAVPVAPLDALEKIHTQVDEVTCLQPELPYGAVGAAYIKFNQTSDAEVLRLLSR